MPQVNRGFRQLLGGLLLGLMCQAALAGPVAYVADSTGIKVIDTATRQVVGAPIDVGAYGPMVVSPDGRRLYVADGEFNGTVTVIDTQTRQVIGTPIPVGDIPDGLAITPDGQFVYVVDYEFNRPPDRPGRARVIDTATLTVVDRIPIGYQPTGIVMSPDGQRAYAVNSYDGNITAIDTATRHALNKWIPVGSVPNDIAITRDGRKLYVVNANWFNISVVDTVALEPLYTIDALSFPVAVATHPNGRHIYVATFDGAAYAGALAVIDTQTDTVVAQAPILPGVSLHRLALTPDGRHVYVTTDDGPVLVVDAVTLQRVGEPIPMDGLPRYVTMGPTAIRSSHR